MLADENVYAMLQLKSDRYFIIFIRMSAPAVSVVKECHEPAKHLQL